MQQYLVAFPDGRLQALPIAWDSRPKATGGQRWFHLYPDEAIAHDDVLHWTRLNQNWNFMCAECHSTGVRKNYDAAHDRFATTWAEIDVGCETCHGQGSRHAEWARRRENWLPFGKSEDADLGLLVRFNERENVSWSHNSDTGNATRSAPPLVLRKEVETCGLCHARRGVFSEAWFPGKSLSDTHSVASLSAGLYQADGQMLDEVYNYGSFKQSKMFAKGVTCSDCHDPHSANLRAPGDGVCAQCHASEKYAAFSHHHHEAKGDAPNCISCHMPARTYMVVHRRHDHGFRVPRPDLSVKFGVPNTCNACHADKSADWAGKAVEQWHGPVRKGFQAYAPAFFAARQGRAGAAEQLDAIASNPSVPSIARATALTELAAQPGPVDLPLIEKTLDDADPMVRISALGALELAPPQQRDRLAAPLLSDPIRGVRIQAAFLLAGTNLASAADQESFGRAAAEFVAAQRLNDDRPEARSFLGNFLAKRAKPLEAEAEFKAALRLSPQFTRAAVNLADLYRGLGRDSDGEQVLRQALGNSPRDAGLHHALGLALVRSHRTDDALGELRQATELDQGNARYAYVYAVALHSAGRADEALALLKSAIERRPNDIDSLTAIVAFSRDTGDFSMALDYAKRLAKILPDDRGLARLIENLKSQVRSPGAK